MKNLYLYFKKNGRAKGVALPLLEKKRLIWQSLSHFLANHLWFGRQAFLVSRNYFQYFLKP